MENIYRTHSCGELRAKDVGKTVKVAGWIHSIRNLGSLVFVTLRDETGIVQIISEDAKCFESVTKESTATITGKVRLRSDKNPKMETGEIEIVLEEIKILGKSLNVLPFEIARSKEASEETRLKYRYLDLRNPVVHDRIVFRSEVIDFLRKLMKESGFTEITTPIITASSPEGARDFVIPSRNYKGKFYALPQAPQIYKQLLMLSGFSRYFQIAPCFRDEDCRADRTLEFYQLDLEMSFVTEEDVYRIGEKIFYETFTHFSKKTVSPAPFRRISYKEAMEKYGTDKPDLRNPLLIQDVSSIFTHSSFLGFQGKCVKAIKVESCDKPNSWYKKLEEYMKEKKASGLSYIKVNEKEITGSIVKYLTKEELDALKSTLQFTDGNVVFFLADQKDPAKLAGILRTKIATDLDLIRKDCFEFCIINDFPMYEYNEEENRWEFGHNPFSMPKGGLEALLKTPMEDIVANQYDFVCNGNEMASGAVRNHDIAIMKKAFELVGYSEEVIRDKFRSLYTAFQYGAPPHAGMAPGIDRILMLLTEEENLREVQVFPPNVSGMDVLMGSPSTLDENQLKELHIKVRE